MLIASCNFRTNGQRFLKGQEINDQNLPVPQLIAEGLVEEVQASTDPLGIEEAPAEEAHHEAKPKAHRKSKAKK